MSSARLNQRHVLLLLLFLLLHPATAQLKRFRRCKPFNAYYVTHLLPHVGARGLTSSSVYSPTRLAPNRPFNPNTPGGPANLPLRRRRKRPLRIAFSNLTNLAPDAEQHDSDATDPAIDFSTTNVQVRGVDEPDIIKTDGRRVFTLSGSLLSVVEVLDNGRRGRRVGKLKLASTPDDMLIDGDFLLLLGASYSYIRDVYSRFTNKPSGEWSDATIIYQVKVSAGVPRLLQTLELEGRYVRARETAGVARLVLQYDPLPSLWLFRPGGRATAKQTKKWNEEIIKLARPAHWLPTYKLRRGNRMQTGVYVRCIDVHRSATTFSGFNLLTVVTIPVNGTLSPRNAVAVISNGEKLYATKKTMYVTTSEFRFDDSDNDAKRWGSNYQTSFHKFQLSATGATYEASGNVTGSVINQFAMHELKGVFFIATTDGAAWWPNRNLSESKVTAFQVDSRTKKMVKIGEVGNLGVGERIFAVRYRWDTAYVVTFREVDPLYIIDLADPRNLRVTGELKIPGFSSYLHNVGPGRLLGVGQEATLTGRTTGAKVSLFDVSDKTNPRELSSWSLKGSYSDAEWDHRAFLYWRKKQIAVMPVTVYSESESFSGAIVLNILKDKITERGRVTHKFRGYTPSIRRNAIIGRNYLWSMSADLLQVNNVDKLKKVESKVKIS